MQNSKIEIEELKELLTYKMKHTFLKKYIKQPVIDEEKLMTLSMIMNQTSLPVEVKKQYIVTTMLVQVALDTHDLVPITNDVYEDEETIMSRQLTVLAGDYYSGLYYLLLAEIKDINMIQMLATTIKEISEYKMKVYYKEVDSFDQYIELIGKIESLLMIRIAAYLDAPIEQQVIEQLMIMNKLVKEKQRSIDQDQSPVLHHWLSNHIADPQTIILGKVESIIKESTMAIEMFLSQKQAHTKVHKEQIRCILNQLIYNYKAVVEEG